MGVEMELTNNYLRFISIVILSGILFSFTSCSPYSGSEDGVVSDFGNDNGICQESAGQDEDGIETNLHNSQDDIYEPWENGGKTPDQYTWEEFWALSEAERNAFVDWFSSEEEFEAWSNFAQMKDTGEEATYPWEKGGKKPDEYTWQEFETLSGIEQEAFWEWFDSAEAYENWLNNAKTNDTVENMPWENGGKTPDQYTWEELQELTDIQKEYFFEWFDSAEAYENWLNNAKTNDTVENMPWENGGKTPDQYTWEELQGLTDIQKEYFFEWFDSTSDFEAWMSSVK